MITITGRLVQTLFAGQGLNPMASDPLCLGRASRWWILPHQHGLDVETGTVHCSNTNQLTGPSAQKIR